MASASSLLSEDQFLCSICLDVFKEPVAISCGHNFCMDCITKYWDCNDRCQCPVCKKVFYIRPDLHVNVFISEMADQFRKSVQGETASSQDHKPAIPGEVPCDFCEGTKLKSLKSCLTCLASYCETHLEPHQRVSALKKHKLIDPVDNLEDRMCKRHQRLLQLFCKTDQLYVCQFCTESDHKLHHTIPLEEEYKERIVQLGKRESQLQQMIQERHQKVEEIKRSVKLSRNDAEKEIAESINFFKALVASIEKSQAELVGVIEQKQKVTEKQANVLIKELELEITELQRRSTELEQLSHTKDPLHFLQSFPSLSTTPLTKDWSKIHVHRHLYVGTVRRAVGQLEEELSKVNMLSDAELKKIQQSAVDVTLDPDTAHPQLILSDDGKQVSLGDLRKNLPDNPERFKRAVSVLGKEGFSTGRFYYEVQVEGKIKWTLGVARETVNRNESLSNTPECGLWTMWLRNENYYKAKGGAVSLSLSQKPQKVGVFVDYEEGLVSFYDVDAKSHIYSYTGCTFTEKLYPYLNPGLNDSGTNYDPLIVSCITKSN